MTWGPDGKMRGGRLNHLDFGERQGRERKYIFIVRYLHLWPVDQIVHAAQPSIEHGMTFRNDKVFLKTHQYRYD